MMTGPTGAATPQRLNRSGGAAAPRSLRNSAPERRRRGVLENGGPVVLDADDRPPELVGVFECLFGSAGVVELALVVVVEHEQADAWLVRMLGVFEHRNVAVGVAGGEGGA